MESTFWIRSAKEKNKNFACWTKFPNCIRIEAHISKLVFVRASRKVCPFQIKLFRNFAKQQSVPAKSWKLCQENVGLARVSGIYPFRKCLFPIKYRFSNTVFRAQLTNAMHDVCTFNESFESFLLHEEGHLINAVPAVRGSIWFAPWEPSRRESPDRADNPLGLASSTPPRMYSRCLQPKLERKSDFGIWPRECSVVLSVAATSTTQRPASTLPAEVSISFQPVLEWATTYVVAARTLLNGGIMATQLNTMALVTVHTDQWHFGSLQRFPFLWFQGRLQITKYAGIRLEWPYVNLRYSLGFPRLVI